MCIAFFKLLIYGGILVSIFRGKAIKLQKPAYTKDKNVYRIDNIPYVYIKAGDRYTITVGAGDNVLVGQLLGVSLGKHTPLHCSVSGTVEDIVTFKETEYIKIKNDGKYELCSDIEPCAKRLSQMTEEEMIDRIRLCGISEWTTISKMKGTAKRLVVNCLDNDPYSHDRKCAVEKSSKAIINGAKIILKILGLRMCEFIVEKNATESINCLVDAIGDSTFFDIIEATDRYPSCTGANVLSLLTNSPEEEGSVCIIDVHSICAIYRAFSQGMPYVRRLVSIGGSATADDGCFDIPLGTPIKQLASQLIPQDRKKPTSYTTVVGGMMTGSLLGEQNMFVEDGTHTITFSKTKELSARVNTCIGCGKCDKICKNDLLPSLFIDKCENDFEDAYIQGGMDMCDRCGACDYVCPAKIPISHIADTNAKALSPNRHHKKAEFRHSPFIRSEDSIRSINFDLVAVMLVLLGWAFVRFGTYPLIIAGVATATALASEFLFNLLTRKGALAVLDLNSVVTALCISLTMSVHVPLYAVAICTFFAIVLVKGAFGGHGKHVVHAAFAARVFTSLFWHDAFVYDASKKYTLFDHVLGNTEGAVGEISALLIAAGAIYLIVRKVISPLIPLMTLTAFSLVGFVVAPTGNAPDYVLLNIIGSSILFAAVFSCTEICTQPRTAIGKISYGLIVGALAALIGRYTSYEGAYIAVVIASAFTPLFNKLRSIEMFDAGDDESENTDETDDTDKASDTDDTDDDADNEPTDDDTNEADGSDDTADVSFGKDDTDDASDGADEGETNDDDDDSDVGDTADDDGDADDDGEGDDDDEYEDTYFGDAIVFPLNDLPTISDPNKDEDDAEATQIHNVVNDDENSSDLSSTAVFNKLFEQMNIDDTDTAVEDLDKKLKEEE